MRRVEYSLLVAGVLLPFSVAAQSASIEGDSAQVRLGGEIYQQHCALCHGDRGRGGSAYPRPIWGPGHDIAKFGTAKGLFEYVQLLMPFDDPAKLNDQQKTAVAAYILARNGTIAPSATLPTGGNSTSIK